MTGPIRGSVDAGWWAGCVRGLPEAACLRARVCKPAAVTEAVLLFITTVDLVQTWLPIAAGGQHLCRGVALLICRGEPNLATI